METNFQETPPTAIPEQGHSAPLKKLLYIPVVLTISRIKGLAEKKKKNYHQPHPATVSILYRGLWVSLANVAHRISM